MTNADLKDALMNRKPIVLRSKRYGELHYKYVNAIRYTLDKDNKIAVQAELLDYNGGSIAIVNASEVFYDNDAGKPV